MFGERRTAAQLIERGVTHRANGRFLEALSCFDQALDSDPESVVASMARANTLVACKLERDAILEYDKVLAREPGNAKASYNKGCAMVNLFRLLTPPPPPSAPFSEAIECFELAERYGHEKAGAVLQVLESFAALANTGGGGSAPEVVSGTPSPRGIELIPDD